MNAEKEYREYVVQYLSALDKQIGQLDDAELTYKELIAKSIEKIIEIFNHFVKGFIGVSIDKETDEWIFRINDHNYPLYRVHLLYVGDCLKNNQAINFDVLILL